MADRSGQRLDGGLLTDRRSADEGVILMWLVPARDTDQTPGRTLDRHVIVGVLHIHRGPDNGMQFNGRELPLLTSPLGISVMPIPEHDIGDDLQDVVERLRKKLSRPQTDGLAMLDGLADRFSVHVFKKGKGAVGPNWSLNYAGRDYRLTAGLAA